MARVSEDKWQIYVTCNCGAVHVLNKKTQSFHSHNEQQKNKIKKGVKNETKTLRGL